MKYLIRPLGMWWYQLLWPADLGKGGDSSKMRMTMLGQVQEMEPVDENISYSNLATTKAINVRPSTAIWLPSLTTRPSGFIKDYFFKRFYLFLRDRKSTHA